MSDFADYAAAFDRAAGSYDEDFGAQPLPRLHRAQVHQALRPWLTPGSDVLDLGCGTGIDALWLARQGLRVVAADLSQGMVEQARQRIDAAGLSSRVRLVGLDPDAPLALPRVDGGFSAALMNFGAPDCFDDLPPLFAALADRLRPDGVLAMAFMGPAHPLSVLARLRSGEIGTVWRMLRGERMTLQVGGRALELRYRLPRAIAAQASPWFQRVDTVAVGLTLPPPWLPGAFERAPRWFARSARWAAPLARAPFIHSMGDHNLVVFRRKA